MQGTRVGTPLYLSPELIKQEPYDYKIDIWATGCVLYHVACLEPPFAGENLIVLGRNIVSKQPSPLPSVFSARLHSFIEKLMSKKPGDRPAVPEMMKLLPPFLKKEFAEASGTPEEAAETATASLTDPAIQKQVCTHAQKAMVPSLCAAQQRKTFDKEEHSKEHFVKVINAEIYQERVQPSQARSMNKGSSEKTKLEEPLQKGVTIKESLQKAQDLSFKEPQKRAEPPKHPKLSENLEAKLPIPAFLEEIKVVPPVSRVDKVDKPSDHSAIVEHCPPENIKKPDKEFHHVQSDSDYHDVFVRPLIRATQRPETALQKLRPTLSLLRSINVNTESGKPAILRPTSARVEKMHGFKGKDQCGDYGEVLCLDVHKKPEKNQNDVPVMKKEEGWHRPHSAMPLGKAVMLPDILRQNYCGGVLYAQGE